MLRYCRDKKPKCNWFFLYGSSSSSWTSLNNIGGLYAKRGKNGLSQKISNRLNEEMPDVCRTDKKRSDKVQVLRRGRKNVQNIAVVARSVINQGDLSKKSAICSCGQNFYYLKHQSGRQMTCPGCTPWTSHRWCQPHRKQARPPKFLYMPSIPHKYCLPTAARPIQPNPV